MSVKKLGQYKGALTPEKVAEGIRAARRNAERLLADAESLFEQGRYPSATALAILAIEEAGKTGVLRGLALARDGKDLKEAWRSYRTHVKKNALGGVLDAVRQGARNLEDFRQLFDADADHPVLLDQLKQISLYTDCLGDANWCSPEEAIDEATARSVLAVARLLQSRREVSTSEIELWVRHLGPVRESDMESMKAGLRRFWAEMKRAGLADSEGDRFDQFVLGELPPPAE